MSKLKTSIGFTGAAFILVFASATANAQATRTWVSGVGDDANPCSRTAPCKTFAGAISKTARGGEISVLDPGGFGNVTITKSITINGTPGAGYGSILVPAASTGVIINIIDPADTLRTVRLNWLDINGAGTGANGIRILSSVPGSSVVIENTNIDGYTGRGISDERTSGGKLVVANTAVRHTADSGIRVAAGGVNKIDVMLTNVRVHNSATAALTLNGGAKGMIFHSVFTGSTFGLDIEQANTEAAVNSSTISGNTTGIFTTGGGVVRLSNSNLAFNGTGINGTVNSFTNNYISGNGAGGTITPIGSPTNATGWQ